MQSLHKADGGLCQSSMILLGHGDLVDRSIWGNAWT
jgi:hypothetical protein